MGTQPDGWRGAIAVVVGLAIAALEILLHKH
jgi:hypothetical protein